MAAPYLTAARTALQGTCLIPRWCLLTQRIRAQAALHVCPAASCSSSRTEPQKEDEAWSSSGGRVEEHQEEPQYIPRRKAKNPMINIGYAWMIGLPTGIIGFILAKRQVDKNRLKQLKIRQRMKKSNEGAYDRSRYQPASQDVRVDQ